MSKLKTVGEIENKLNEIIPVDTAESWDNVGLLVGDRDKSVRRILVALDATENVINEAISKKAELIVTHHPVIFRSLHSVRKDNCKNIYKLIENGISVYSAHTNFDKYAEGTNYVLSEKLLLKSTEVLNKEGIGEIGSIKESFDEEINLSSYIKYIKKALGLDTINVVGDLNKKIEKVAICSGSGGSFLQEAIDKGADLYISGDISYSVALKAVEYGIAMLDITHYVSENIAMPKLKEIVENIIDNSNVEVMLSEINDQPFKLV